jgi:hypothetical protein
VKGSDTPKLRESILEMNGIMFGSRPVTKSSEHFTISCYPSAVSPSTDTDVGDRLTSRTSFRCIDLLFQNGVKEEM